MGKYGKSIQNFMDFFPIKVYCYQLLDLYIYKYIFVMILIKKIIFVVVEIVTSIEIRHKLKIEPHI